MQNLTDLFNQLKNAGLAPKMIITLPPDPVDVKKVTQLQANLKSAGITTEVHIQLSVDSAKLESPVPAAGVDSQQTFTVMVSPAKTNCFTFTKMDKAGKPIMEIREPRVQLLQGTRFNVSATHKASDKDSGDGSVTGTGGIKYFLVVDCPTNRNAEGLYVRQSDVTRL